jgi:transcriptional regulator
MYVPELYRPPNTSWAAELIRSNPLALLVTNCPNGPYATHLPTILDEDSIGKQSLIGGRIFGHLNRQNPHWNALEKTSTALLVFQGPHGYVSPSVYQTQPAAPTWDFTAVHVHGRLDVLSARDETLQVILTTVRTFEQRLGTGWDMTGSLDYFDQLLSGVGAFKIEIDSVDCMLKLSQEKTAEVRERVIQAFSQSDTGNHRALASLMRLLDHTH